MIIFSPSGVTQSIKSHKSHRASQETKRSGYIETDIYVYVYPVYLVPRVTETSWAKEACGGVL